MTTRQFRETSALRIFLSYFKPHRKLFFLDMCCALMIALIDLAFPMCPGGVCTSCCRRAPTRPFSR